MYSSKFPFCSIVMHSWSLIEVKRYYSAMCPAGGELPCVTRLICSLIKMKHMRSVGFLCNEGIVY